MLETNTQNTGVLRKFQRFLFDRGYLQSENEEASFRDATLNCIVAKEK